MTNSSGMMYDIETVVMVTRFTLTGLLPFTNYSVEVAAMTINGTGPFSAPITNLSGHEGM